MKLPVYLDHNATTPCLPEVVEAMLPYFSDIYANASSRQHLPGWRAEEAIEIAREQIAELIQARPKELIFTSGATEAVNLAIKGITEPFTGKNGHIITTVTEHKAVLDTCAHLQAKGMDITYLPVDSSGMINLSELETAIRPETRLITIMMANNETGVLQPVEAVYQIARRHHIPLFTDATQIIGKSPVRASRYADFLCFSAHKMYGPKGAGALYINKQTNHPLIPQLHGGGHEQQLRSGTLNVPAIVGFGQAAQIASETQTTESQRIKLLRNQLETALLSLKNTKLNGDSEQRMSHVSNISFTKTNGAELLKSLNRNLAVSSGSACSSVTSRPSHVLTAMGVEAEVAMASVRFSLGRQTTPRDIAFAIEEVTQILSSTHA